MPVVERTSFALQYLAILELGNDVRVPYVRRARDEVSRVAPATGCGPMWVPEAASCLTTTAPINSSIDRWLVDTGCGYDLGSREQASSVRKLIQTAYVPDGEWYNHRGPGGNNVRWRGQRRSCAIHSSIYTDCAVSGFRCMNLGYALILPKGEYPYFLLPQGQ